MNTVANRTRESDLPMASNLVRGTRPPIPTFQRKETVAKLSEAAEEANRMCFSVSTSIPATCTSSQKKIKTVFTMLVDTLT